MVSVNDSLPSFLKPRHFAVHPEANGDNSWSKYKNWIELTLATATNYKLRMETISVHDRSFF